MSRLVKPPTGRWSWPKRQSRTLHMLGERQIFHDFIPNHLMPPDAIVRTPTKQHELSIRDRVPPAVISSGLFEVRKPNEHHEKDVRLHQALPEAFHELTATERQQVRVIFKQPGNGLPEQIRSMRRVSVREEKQLPARMPRALSTRPGLTQPPLGKLLAVQNEKTTCSPLRHGTRQHSGLIITSVVYHHDVELRIRRCSDRLEARDDVERFVP